MILFGFSPREPIYDLRYMDSISYCRILSPTLLTYDYFTNAYTALIIFGPRLSRKINSIFKRILSIHAIWRHGSGSTFCHEKLQVKPMNQ